MPYRQLVGGASWDSEIRIRYPDGNDRVIREPERILWHEFRKIAMNIEPGRSINVLDISKGETYAPRHSRELDKPEIRVENRVNYSEGRQIDEITGYWDGEGMVRKTGNVTASITNFGRIVLPTMVPVDPRDMNR